MTLTIELPPEIEAKLTEEAAKRGITPSEYVLDALRRLVQVDSEGKHAAPAQSILRLMEEIHSTAPEEVWQELPSDLSNNYEHYWHGPQKVVE